MNTIPTSVTALSKALISFRIRAGLSQSQTVALIERLPLKTLQKYEQGGSEPPAWVQTLLIDALEKYINDANNSLTIYPNRVQ
jgi:hypothetical protein